MFDSDGKSRQARGYGAAHDRLRRDWQPLVEAGQANCCRCGGWIVPGTPWHLDHDDNDRRKYKGVAHAVCNLSAAGRAGARSGRGGTGKPLRGSTGRTAASGPTVAPRRGRELPPIPVWGVPYVTTVRNPDPDGVPFLHLTAEGWRGWSRVWVGTVDERPVLPDPALEGDAGPVA
jgi:hypothetical protein